MMKKIPLTKAGKPDKRYVSSPKAKSKATKKAPTKRLVKRREKDTKPGFYPNPSPSKKTSLYLVAAHHASGAVGYYDGFRSIDDNKKMAALFTSKAQADKTATHIAKMFPRGEWFFLVETA